ncbi:MAG TPA: hypothetical protein VFY16_05735 [Gemmatimonadaceae bacterium]|nr:hypothetical protein [Gemmatimonadaceae bacterium]
MRRLVLLVVLALVTTLAVKAARGRSPSTTATTPSGTYRVGELERRCERGVCMAFVQFYTGTQDRAALRAEAHAVGEWIRPRALERGERAVMVVAIRPGLLYLLPPRSARAYGFVSRYRGEWAFVGEEDTEVSFRTVPIL